ncbi:glycosylphosphatidylinositol anchor attachment 1 protein-like isoform X2 [Rhopilema esculentum]|uniref:glycosylphosphatidylinositol anchor attachment 1 protein-like isoform X2 n=1 Tax=Rhopilema esculentum TaxID=499914 RepID=UPI0031D727D0
MGLLSDPEMRKKLRQFLDRWRTPLSILGYVGGLLWLVFLASDDFNARTYISENALLPALVETKYSEEHTAHRHYDQLSEICKINFLEGEFIERQMVSAGLEVFHQNVSCLNGQGIRKNIYGILRSTRSSGVESLVLNVPNRPNCRSNGALALLFSLIDHFKVQNYWAKDIIFLVSGGDLCGVPAWLASYHGETQKPGIQASDLKGHAGKIQAAIVVDFPNAAINGFDVLYEGSNGLEPNLDLISMTFAVSRSEEIPIKLHNQDTYDNRYAHKSEEFQSCLGTLARCILRLASGYPTGEHGYYVKYRIEAVTLRNSAVEKYGKEASFNEMGRTVEGIFRSLNNLQEHMHQSFFMYLLPAGNRYISIALYMPVLGCILIGPLLHAVKLWMEVTKPDTVSSKGAPEILVSATVFLASSIGLSYGYRYLLSSIVFQDKAGLNIEKEAILNIVLAPIALIFSMGILSKTRNEQEWKARKLITTFLLILVIGMTSLLNFSLALVVAIPLVPAVLFLDMKPSRLAGSLNYVLMFLSTPYAVIMLLSALYLKVTRMSLEWKELFEKSLQNSHFLIKYAFSNSHLDVWTLDILFFAVIPIWIMSVSLVFHTRVASR